MGVGRRIKQRREEMNLSQKKLADYIGVSAGTIGNWEVEANSPSEKQFHKLFEILNCEPNFLFQDYIPKKELPDENVEELKTSLIDFINSTDDINVINNLISYVDYLIWKEEQS